MSNEGVRRTPGPKTRLAMTPPYRGVGLQHERGRRALLGGMPSRFGGAGVHHVVPSGAYPAFAKPNGQITAPSDIGPCVHRAVEGEPDSLGQTRHTDRATLRFHVANYGVTRERHCSPGGYRPHKNPDGPACRRTSTDGAVDCRGAAAASFDRSSMRRSSVGAQGRALSEGRLSPGH